MFFYSTDEDALKKRKKLTRRTAKDDSSNSEFEHSFFPTFTTSQVMLPRSLDCEVVETIAILGHV